MKHELHWNNAQGMNLYSSLWDVPAPRALMLLVHGQGEHIGRYEHVANFFNARGIAVWGYDQQGFGRSAGARGHARDVQDYLNDLKLFISIARERFPNTPLILYGHSMGGNVTLHYTLRYAPSDLKGIVATSPWVQLAFAPPAIKVWAGRLLRSLFPTLALSSGLDTRHLSTDPEVVKAYNADPLVHDKVSAAAGISLMESARWIDGFSGGVPAPLLLMHSGADAITSPAATHALSQRLAGPVTWKEWPGLYHEMHNEPAQQEVLRFIAEWIEGILES